MPVDTQTRVPSRAEMLRRSDNVRRAAISSGEVTPSPYPETVKLIQYQDKIKYPAEGEVIGEAGDNIYQYPNRAGILLKKRNKLLTIADVRRYHDQYKIDKIPIYKLTQKR